MKKYFAAKSGVLLIIMMLIVISPLVAQIKIMPLGDSITRGEGGPQPYTGYRDDLYNLLLGEGVNFDFVGSQQDGTPGQFDIDHEGHGGFRADMIDGQMSTILGNYDPDIVILHIGTNDITNNDDNQSTITEIESIIDKIYNYRTDHSAKILLCSLIPRNDSKDDINSQLNSLIKNLYYDKLNGGYNIFYVSQNELFKTNNNWAADYFDDSVHPNDTGYNLMAQVNFVALMNAINQTAPIVIDNFNRSSLGAVWDADPEYQIIGNELVNTSTTSAWDYIATYLGAVNPDQVSIKWSLNADQLGINEGGIVMGLDTPSSEASGYLIWKTLDNHLNLFEIRNGSPFAMIPGGDVPGQLNFPSPGDVFKVVMRTDNGGHHFDCYINDQFDGTLTDPDKKQGNSSRLYAGVMLKGNLNNNIDDFNIIDEEDIVPPDAVIDLTVLEAGYSSVTLYWTATGDDGATGRAIGYDIRYSTAPIDENNFFQATQVLNAPFPSDPGVQDTAVVSGLQSNKTYYLALKVYDETPNFSAISNVVSAKTEQSNAMVDDFNNRTDLGPNWNASPEFQIVNDELANTATINDWGYVAVFNARANPMEVSFKWGVQADATGIEEGGFALMLDTAFPSASGYFTWIRPSNRTINLFTIANGFPDHRVGSAVTMDVGAPTPQAGSIFKVEIITDSQGHHFDHYIDGQYAGRITDPLKEQGNVSEVYAGVMLKGGLNNNIDDFRVVGEIGDPYFLEYVSGNDQIASIGGALPESLVVRVTDEYHIPLANVPVNFKVVEGQATLDIMPPPDKVAFEAEWGTLTAPMQIGNAGDAAGGQYIYGPSGDPGQGRVDYIFDVIESGTYVIWARYYALSDTEDSFFFQVDGGNIILWDLDEPYNTWLWAKVSDRNAGEVSENLNVGQHTLAVIKRENNCRLDKIILSKDPSFVPTGKEEMSGYVTNSAGEAAAELTLGTTMGEVKVHAEARGLIGSPVEFIITAIAGPAAKIEYVSGNNQTGVGGQQLQAPFVVRLSDQYGNPRQDWQVTFQEIQGGGFPSNSQPVLTDTLGLASTIWTLGTEVATNIVNAVSNGLQGSPVQFTATATSGVAQNLVYDSGDNQSGVVNQPLQNPFKVKVADNQGNPIVNYQVLFKVTAGGGTLDGSSLTQKVIYTDTDGFAQVTLTLGTTSGTQNNTVEASALAAGHHLTGSPYVFKATANPDVPIQISYVSGNGQTGAAGMPLSAPFVVQIIDQFGNGIVGHEIIFEIKSGGGSLNPGGPWYTEANGMAQVRLTLGTEAGVINEVWASAENDGNPLQNSPIIFQANAGTVTTLAYEHGNNQTGSAGWPLEDSLKVKVLDNYGNSVGGYPVSWTCIGDNKGTVNGENQVTVNTDINGVSKVLFMCPSKPGVNSEVEAKADGLNGSPLTFNIKVAGLDVIQKISGDNQIGTVGTSLPQPFKTRVVDSLGHAIPNYQVIFEVKQGDGNFSDGSKIDTILTNSEKVAETTLILGPRPGNNNNIVEASAYRDGNIPLHNSPLTFTASAQIGEPDSLAYVDGNHQYIVVGNQLEKPLVVKVTDKCGNPIVDHNVNFEVKAGGGFLDNGLQNVTKTTDDSGKTQVSLTVGTVAGEDNNIVEAKAERSGGGNLRNSPFIFYASARPSDADSLMKISGDNQQGRPVRERLLQPFVVKVTDREGNGVVGHPVKFSVVAGGGTFDALDGDTVKTINASNDGTASVYYYPGPRADEPNIIQARSWNGAPELNGSPVQFTVTPIAGSVSPSVSSISCSPVEVPADGQTKTNITITLTDNYSNPISNKAVIINVSGTNNFITQPSSLTDANGKAYGELSSTKAELKTVTAYDVTDGIQLTSSAEVRFKNLAASYISYSSGTNQQGNFGTALREPIKARVTDVNGNAVYYQSVYFEAYQGGGIIYDLDKNPVYTGQPVFTDSNGIAAVYWILGPSEEVNRARATSSGLSGTAEYIATAHEGQATTIAIASGNNQSGTAGYRLPNPLVVKIADANGDPIVDHQVTFKVTFGGGSFNDKSQLTLSTDYFGEASVYFTLGRAAGVNTVESSAAGLAGSPQYFTASGYTGVAAKISKVSGDGYTGTVGGTISGISVVVTDLYDNIFQGGYDVLFSVIEGNATIIDDQPVTTGSNGQASTSISLGTTAGEVIVQAYAVGLINNPLKFKVYATAAAPVSMSIDHGDDQQGTIGRELVYPLGVLVRDVYNNPVSDEPVSFVRSGGNGILLTPQQIYTDENGIAEARLQLGSETGAYQVMAINNNLNGSPLYFDATGVTNKFPLFVNLNTDITSPETQLISFTVNANDDDLDPLTYEAQGLPSGANFDATATKKFNWTPTLLQAGEYEVHFIVQDNKGGLDEEAVNITVTNLNHRPQITNYLPAQDYLSGHKSIGETFNFSVTVNDQDPDDEITYEWYYDNDLLVSTTSTYNLYVNSENINLGSHNVSVIVSDGYDSVAHSWELYIKTPVELVSFSAEVVPREGVYLNWETNYEANNAGFNILRSRSINGTYKQINASLIPNNETKQYRFLDLKVKVGETYYYKLEDVSMDGKKTDHEPIRIYISKPDKYSLSQNYPNPFNPITKINYQLPDQRRVTLKIYNLLGQEVITLINEQKEPGYHTAIWNGLDKHGNQVSSGIYYYRIVAGSFIQSKKMVLIK